MILDAITSSPLNVFFTIVIGISLAYLYCRKPSSSSSSSSQNSRPRPDSTNRLYPGAGGVVDEELQRTIAQIERQERDMIRQEQDEAYFQSLKADREKQLKKEQEIKGKEAQERQEKERQQKQEDLIKKLTKLRSEIMTELPEEPDPHSDSDQDKGTSSVVKLLFKLPDGTRIQRMFHRNDKIKHLYWYVFSLPNAPLQFKMTTNFPKRDLPGRPPMPEDFDDEGLRSNKSTIQLEPNCEDTLEKASLTETQIIFVYDLEV